MPHSINASTWRAVETYNMAKLIIWDRIIMKITFLSNYFNHHQKHISNELSKRCSLYHFVSTSKMREERKSLGYGEDVIPGYVVDYSEDTKESIIEIINCSNVAIFGAAPISLIKERVRNNKLVFKYCERPFKKKSCILKSLPRLIKWHYQYPKKSNLYLLCASAYAACDFHRYRLFKNKAYKWGYFPETKIYDIIDLIKQKDHTHILWCGRFLDWKHPDDVIQVARKLLADGYSFTLDFIGNGIMESQLRSMVEGTELENCICFLGSMPPSKVRNYMEKAGIYLFTSDKQEGWGAVLNESMNSGCAVVASHAIGSVPYLIENNVNGLIYESGNVDMLCEKVKYLLDNYDEQNRLGQAAYRTITELWNAEVAAERLIQLSQRILDGVSYPNIYETGPCSKAEILSDDWFTDK